MALQPFPNNVGKPRQSKVESNTLFPQKTTTKMALSKVLTPHRNRVINKEIRSRPFLDKRFKSHIKTKEKYVTEKVVVVKVDTSSAKS